jgi:hypothetical protein
MYRSGTGCSAHLLNPSAERPDLPFQVGALFFSVGQRALGALEGLLRETCGAMAKFGFGGHEPELAVLTVEPHGIASGLARER